MTEVQIITREDAKRLGNTKYFTGEPCPKGHIAERRTANRGCVICQQAEAAIRYKMKREDPTYMAAARKRAKEWATKNPEQYRANQAKWRKDSGPQWLAKNLKKVRGQQADSKRRAAKSDPDYHKKVHRHAKARNPEEYSRKATERTRSGPRATQNNTKPLCAPLGPIDER